MAVSSNTPAIIGCLSDISVGEISSSLLPRHQLTSSRRHRVGGFQVAVSFVCLFLYGCEQTDGHCQPDVGRLIVWQYVLQMSPQYGELRPTSGWDRFVSLGHPTTFQSGFASLQRYCTACSSGRQPNFAALNREHYLCSVGRPSRLALAHISVYILFCHLEYAAVRSFDRQSIINLSSLVVSETGWRVGTDEDHPNPVHTKFRSFENFYHFCHVFV